MEQSARLIVVLTLLILLANSKQCHSCYNFQLDTNCISDVNPDIDAYTLHMSVHPHLDAFWIFDFQSYYDPKPTDGGVLGYFRSNRFNSVKQIFDTALQVLDKSKKFRESGHTESQKAHRSFFNSQMGFFKRWYSQAKPEDKEKVKEILKTKYWQILGGGYVQHDEGCAYYDDIIENFQIGLHFLKKQFNYHPKTAVSADSFGHSQSTLAILAHLGIQGFFVERSDEHILKQNKTQFIWKAKSANGRYYGALPTHIRWAIHGFQDQFIPGGSETEMICQTKARFMENMRKQNTFLKKILKSNHIMRYFGHDFQRFDDHSYYVIQGMMEQFARQKCGRTTAVYGNPTEYFKTLMGEVFSKTKKIETRTEDIMPIWDYDSGLYWTGYYTTDPLHKKNYRDAARYLHVIRKAFLPAYVANPTSQTNKQNYKQLEQFSQIVAYLQHHDGISGTSKYAIMDKYESEGDKKLSKLKQTIIPQMFKNQFSEEINNRTFDCNLESQCQIPDYVQSDVYLKVFKSGGQGRVFPIIVRLHQDQSYQPENCDYYEINCLCTAFPCPCSLYIYTKLSTYTIIKLKKVQERTKDANLLRQIEAESEPGIKYNETHFQIEHNNQKYAIGYKRLNADPTQRKYDHLTRYGTQSNRAFTIKSGKYALGNNIKTQANLSKIRKVYQLLSDYMRKYIIIWGREQMKTTITITNSKLNEWKVETYSAAEAGKLEDLYLQVSAPHINNEKKFYTDSNGWLVMKRELYKHEDYQAFFSEEGFDNIDGNSYPMTTFAYIQDINNPHQKMSINTDRPQGVISYHPGTIWVNYDRLSSDDGKWVFETTYRNQYQKFTHYITVENTDNNERILQRKYDEPLLIEGHEIRENINIMPEEKAVGVQRSEWHGLSSLSDIKFQVKPWNDTSTILRLHNLHDNAEKFVTLYSNDNICIFLTAFYGNTVKFSKIYETSMGGNMEYSQFLRQKWNWDEVTNLKEQNNIFNKEFGERITMRPLEIRTFVLEGLTFSEQCKSVNQLNFDNEVTKFQVDTEKQMPVRSSQEKQNQLDLIDYLLNGDHCQTTPPVLTTRQASNSQSKTPESTTKSPTIIQQTPQNPPKSDSREQTHQIVSQRDQQSRDQQIQFDDGQQSQNFYKQQMSERQKIEQKVETRSYVTKQQKTIYFKGILARVKQDMLLYGESID